jgi:hypothetical protein
MVPRLPRQHWLDWRMVPSKKFGVGESMAENRSEKCPHTNADEVFSVHWLH